MKMIIAELKKLLHLFRADPKSLGAGILPPTVVLLAFFITVGSFSSIDISIVNNDSGPYGAVLEQSLLSEKSPLGNQPYFENEELSLEETKTKFEDETLYAYVVIPEDFSKKFGEGKMPEIQYCFNNYNTDIAKNLRLYFAEGLLHFYKVTDSSVQIQVDEKMNAPKQIPWFDIIASSVFMLAFLLGVVTNTLYLLSMEKQHGTLLLYQLAPNNILPGIVSRILVALLTGCIAAAVSALFIYLLTGISYLPYVWGILPALLLMGTLYSLLAMVVGLYVDSFAGSIVFSLLCTLVFWFLSGATFSIQNNTGILQTIGEFIPNTYALSHIRGIIFSMDPSIGSVSYSAGWIIMIAYTIAAFVLVWIVYKRKLVHHVK